MDGRERVGRPGGQDMNDADLKILEMHYNGLDAEVISDELRLSVATVKEVIKAFEDGEYKTR
jgi:DNA-binding NarL/FixJ family response regulator